MDYADAISQCAAQGKRLATPTSMEEQRRLMSLVSADKFGNSAYENVGIWIGLSQKTNDAHTLVNSVGGEIALNSLPWSNWATVYTQGDYQTEPMTTSALSGNTAVIALSDCASNVQRYGLEQEGKWILASLSTYTGGNPTNTFYNMHSSWECSGSSSCGHGQCVCTDNRGYTYPQGTGGYPIQVRSWKQDKEGGIFFCEIKLFFLLKNDN